MDSGKEIMFSILIANYNNGCYLEECIQSVLNQTYSDWEIIIVDDASTDNSFDIYRRYEGYDRIKILYNEENRGCGYTKRRCVEEASGEICGFLDPDDTLSDNALTVMIEAHLKNPKSAIVHSKSYKCDASLNIEHVIEKDSNFNPKDPYFFNIGGGISAFSSFKKCLYDKTEKIDPYLRRAVDQDLYLKLVEVGEVTALSDVLYYYRFHEGGISTNSNVSKALFWHWVVIMSTAKRRGINVEDQFSFYFIERHKYNVLESKYKKVEKYTTLNNFLSKLKRIFKS